jgi:hypothetical protein
VLHQLDWEPDFNSSAVGVAVEDGVATLTGTAASYADKLAIELALVDGAVYVQCIPTSTGARPSRSRASGRSPSTRASKIESTGSAPPRP